jgi:lipoate-protein ligase A
MLRWLFLDDGQGNGAENMAADEFILNRVQLPDIEAILRVYSFNPPAVSIGFHQDPDEILDIDALRHDRVSLVRRITGGRALLHDEEITYCIAASIEGGIFKSGFQERYMVVSETLTEVLGALGVKARISRGEKESGDKKNSSPCLVSVSRHEITAGGRKIVASAQRSSGAVFIQHGSILLGAGSKKISKYLRGDWGNLDRYVTSIFEETGINPGYRKCAEVIKEAFAGKFGVEFEDLSLSRRDRSDISAAALKKSAEFH